MVREATEVTLDPALKEIWMRGNGAGQEFNKRKSSTMWMLEIFRFQGQFGLKYNLWETVFENKSLD